MLIRDQVWINVGAYDPKGRYTPTWIKINLGSTSLDQANYQL